MINVKFLYLISCFIFCSLSLAGGIKPLNFLPLPTITSCALPSCDSFESNANGVAPPAGWTGTTGCGSLCGTYPEVTSSMPSSGTKALSFSSNAGEGVHPIYVSMDLTGKSKIMIDVTAIGSCGTGVFNPTVFILGTAYSAEATSVGNNFTLNFSGLTGVKNIVLSASDTGSSCSGTIIDNFRIE